MNNLVIMKSEQALTTSLKVAEVFKKEHRSVLNSIRNLTAQNYAVKKMFVKSTYVNKRGQEQPMYYMNRDGFSLLAMGFTGQDAMKFKLAYIEAFDKMDAYIRGQQQSLPQTPEERLALTMQVTNHLVPKVNKIQKTVDRNSKDIDFLKNKSEIDSSQRHKFEKARKKRAIEVCGGKDSNFYHSKESGKVFRQMMVDVHDQYDIGRYEDLKKEDFDDAMTFVKNWYPDFRLQRKIQEVNAQTSLHLYKESKEG